MTKILTIICVLCLSFSSCVQKKSIKDQAIIYQCPMQCEDDKIYHASGSCPVCNMNLQLVSKDDIHNNMMHEEMSETSIFNLSSTWNTEEGETIKLKDLKGKTLVMVMIYTSCKAACPRLVADMRSIEKKIPINIKNKIQYVMISIDPETDTPDRLKKFAIENQMDGEQWTFLQGNLNSVREFANVLAVKYKQISPMDFSHSNIISVYSSKGELVHQQEGLGVDNEQTILEIIKTTN